MKRLLCLGLGLLCYDAGADQSRVDRDATDRQHVARSFACFDFRHFLEVHPGGFIQLHGKFEARQPREPVREVIDCIVLFRQGTVPSVVVDFETVA